MHPAAYQFAAPRLIAAAPKRVLEIGSLDVNSSVQGLSLRALLPDAAWLGIDSAAGPERAPHGCDGGDVQPGEHYRGITPDELRAMLDGWDDVDVTHDAAAGDVYAVATKRAEG